MSGRVSSLQLKKQQRYKEWKSRTTKLNRLRQQRKERFRNTKPEEGMVVGGFEPCGHGFHFLPETSYKRLETFNDVPDGKEESEMEEDGQCRKRKLFEPSDPADAKPWYCRYLPGDVQVLNDYKHSFQRSVVRATATKNVDLLREILQERAGEEADLKSSPTARKLFPEYPSRSEKYREELDYALLIAVCSNYCDIVEMLLEAGARLSQFNEWYPFIMNAVETQRVDLAKILLKHGSDPNASRHDGTGLHAVARKCSRVTAAVSGDFSTSGDITSSLQMARILLEAGADVNLKNEDRGSTPLHEAVKFGNTEVVEFLLAEGADVNAEDKQKRTPLHWAALSGNLEHVKMLQEKGASALAVDEKFDAPWMLAMRNKFDGVARFLCSFHDVNVTDANGRTPLHVACAAGCVQSVEVLLKEGANFNAIDNHGNTPLIDAAGGKLAVVEMLLTRPHINVSQQNAEGRGAIHVAVDRLAATAPNSSLGATVDKFSRPATRIVNLLIAKGADVNQLPANGEALVVKHANNDPVFKFLLDAGADLNAVSAEGQSTLSKIVQNDKDESSTGKTEKLLAANVDVEKLSRVTYRGLSPLQHAVTSHELVKLLINSGAETSHLISWLENTDEGKGTRDSLPSETKELLNLNTNTGNLMDMARSAVLRHLGHRNVPNKIQGLMLPKTLQKFLTHEIYFSWKSETC